MALSIETLVLPHGKGLPLPKAASDEAAGLDLPAAIPENAPLILLPGMRERVPTGLALAIPKGFEGQIRPRSGLAAKYGITCLNAQVRSTVTIVGKFRFF